MNKQSPIILYLIMLLGVVLGFLYTSQVNPAAQVPPVPANYELTSMRGLDTLKIDYSMFSSEQFQQLRIFGSLPVQPQSGGKTDPFR